MAALKGSAGFYCALWQEVQHVLAHLPAQSDEARRTRCGTQAHEPTRCAATIPTSFAVCAPRATDLS